MAIPPRIVPVRAHTRVIAIPVPVPVRQRAAQRFAGDAPMRPAVAPEMPMAPPSQARMPMPMVRPPMPMRPPMAGQVPGAPMQLGAMGTSGSPQRMAGRTIPPPTRSDTSEGGGPPVTGGPPAAKRQAIGNITDYAPQAKMPPAKKRMRGR